MSDPPPGELPRDILSRAEALLRSADAAPSALRERAAALLARQALEAALTDYWRRRSPAMVDCPTRAQIRCLDDPSVAQRVSSCWAVLSRACHHHPYELTPGANELAAALTAVRESCDALGLGDAPG